MGATLYVQPVSSAPFEAAIRNTATIGRTRENAVCLSSSPQVSRQHAMIRCHNGYQYQIIDLGSRNGTFVNEQRVVMPVTVEAGARIRMADNVLTLGESSEDRSAEQQQITVVGSLAADFLESRLVALLVCDIRGFSSMSERMASGDLAQVLVVWFRELGNLVADSGGTIDKFIGVAVLAYWGGSAGPLNCVAAFETAKNPRLSGAPEMALRRKVRGGDCAPLREGDLEQRGCRGGTRRHDHLRRSQHGFPLGIGQQGGGPGGVSLGGHGATPA